jgi:hypothetical protein
MKAMDAAVGEIFTLGNRNAGKCPVAASAAILNLSKDRG